MNSHTSLILFWESLNIMVICFGYKIIPKMIGIQEGYNKNFHIKCIEYYEKFDSLRLFWDMKMLILESCQWVVENLRNTCVKVCESRSMHVWWTAMWWNQSMTYLLIVFLMSGGRGRAMVFSYQSTPLGACA